MAVVPFSTRRLALLVGLPLVVEGSQNAFGFLSMVAVGTAPGGNLAKPRARRGFTERDRFFEKQVRLVWSRGV
ncbi:MAG: hypothetical protein U1D30_05505 [Planctomycetota bacterium]